MKERRQSPASQNIKLACFISNFKLPLHFLEQKPTSFFINQNINRFTFHVFRVSYQRLDPLEARLELETCRRSIKFFFLLKLVIANRSVGSDVNVLSAYFDKKENLRTSEKR